MVKLGQNVSVRGNTWHQYSYEENEVLALCQKFQISDRIARCLCGYDLEMDHMASFLSPKLRNDLPDPNEFKDMSCLLECLYHAMIQKQVIGILADYDVDGATSCALWVRFFRQCGVEFKVHIPDRLKEGYGPNHQAINDFHDQGIEVIMLIDCGTSDVDVLTRAHEKGLKIIVIDHHLAPAQLPPCQALINPNRSDETGRWSWLCAVGVCFIVLVGLCRHLRNKGFFNGVNEPDLICLLDLVALGTVCDVVALKGLNRTYVAQGLKVLRQGRNVGIGALCQILDCDIAKLNASDLGFLIGPCINAPGRIGDADMGWRLLTTEDENQADELARILVSNNQMRKEIEKKAFFQAVEQIENHQISSCVMMAVGKDWHPGIIGIVASRLKEKYAKPAFVFTHQDNVYKASARSIPGIDLGSLVISARDKNLLIDGGGHKMAAGLTVCDHGLNALCQFFDRAISYQMTTLPPSALWVHGCLSLNAVQWKLMEELKILEPFGQGHPKPRFIVLDVCCSYRKQVGQDHVSCILQNPHDSKNKIRAIAFRCINTPVGDFLLKTNHKSVFHVLGYLQEDSYWGQHKVQFVIEDISF